MCGQNAQETFEFLATLLDERVTVDEIRTYVSGIFGKRWDREALVFFDLFQSRIQSLEIVEPPSHLIGLVSVVKLVQGRLRFHRIVRDTGFEHAFSDVANLSDFCVQELSR